MLQCALTFSLWRVRLSHPLGGLGGAVYSTYDEEELITNKPRGVHTCRTCRRAAAEGGGRGDGGRDRRRQVAAGVARGRGRAVPRHGARDGQREFGRDFLLHGLLLPPRSVGHEPDDKRVTGYRRENCDSSVDFVQSRPFSFVCDIPDDR